MDFMGDIDRDRGDFDMGMGMLEGGRRGQMDRGEGMVDMGDGRRDDGFHDMTHGDFLGGVADQGLGRMQRDRGRQNQMDASMGGMRDRRMEDMRMGDMGMRDMGMRDMGMNGLGDTGIQQDRMMNQERQMMDQGGMYEDVRMDNEYNEQQMDKREMNQELIGQEVMDQQVMGQDIRIDNQLNEQQFAQNQMNYGIDQSYGNQQLAFQETKQVAMKQEVVVDYGEYEQDRKQIICQDNYAKVTQNIEIFQETPINFQPAEVIQQISEIEVFEPTETEFIEQQSVYSNYQQTEIIEERPITNYVQTEVVEEQQVYRNYQQTEVIQQVAVYNGFEASQLVQQNIQYNAYRQVQKQVVEEAFTNNGYQQQLVQQKEVIKFQQPIFDSYVDYQQATIQQPTLGRLKDEFIVENRQQEIFIEDRPIYAQQNGFAQKAYNQAIFGNKMFQKGQLETKPIQMSMQTKDVQLLHPAKFEGPISVHKIFEWKLQFGRLNFEDLQLPNKKMHIKEITKIKCLSQEGFQKHRQIKVVHNTIEDVFFAADVERQQLGLPLQYAWFAKIINAKLINLGYDLEKPFISEQNGFNMALDGAYCKGLILKRSQFLKKWQKRFIIITMEGLFSYKNPNEPFSFSFKASSVKYIWSRFEIQNGCLVIKIMHGLEKTEFAIPIMNYCIKSEYNWLWAFYRLLMERNIMHQLK